MSQTVGRCPSDVKCPPSGPSSCEEEEDAEVAQRHRRSTLPARADHRRGEEGVALVPRHQHVTDVPLAAGRAHLAGDTHIQDLGRPWVSLQFNPEAPRTW